MMQRALKTINWNLEPGCIVRIDSGWSLLLDSLLQAVQKLLLKLYNFLNVAEQSLNVFH